MSVTSLDGVDGVHTSDEALKSSLAIGLGPTFREDQSHTGGLRLCSNQPKWTVPGVKCSGVRFNRTKQGRCVLCFGPHKC